jgi:glyoxylase-like metal-dependent hydrolase (beta-lactamase superfamily II)
MHLLSGGRLRMRRSIYFPGSDPTEMIEMSVASILLKHSQGNVLFDTGCHPEVAMNPEARWGSLVRVMTPIMQSNDNVLESLKAIGHSPDDIDVVVCSHLHPDHCGCNQFFRKAKFFINARELAAAKAPEAEKMGYFRADWDHPRKIQEVTSETDVFGDGKIRLIELPGHTPGTMGAIVQLERHGRFLLAADALSLRANLDENIVPKNTWDGGECLRSFERIRELEREGASVICGHDDAQWQSLRKEREYYE